MPHDWLTDDLVEPVAIAACYAGFRTHREIGPVEYWRGVTDGAKAEYRKAARVLLLAAADGARFMTHCPPHGLHIGRYMGRVGISDERRARKHIAAVYAELPTIWQAARQSTEE